MAELISISQEQELLRACRVLFGSQAVLGRNFLASIQPDGVRVAYLSRARLTHPDRFPGASLVFLKGQAQRFRKVVAAYDVVNRFLSDRKRGFVFVGRRGGVRQYPEEMVQRRGKRCASQSFLGGRDSLFSGLELPQQPLPLGLYLNYRGLVSYTELAQALVWQRRQRPRLGELSQRWGRLSEFEVKAILELRRQGVCRFGEKAIVLGLLSQFQVDTMIYFQRSKQRPIGEFFVEQGLISSSSIEGLVSDLHEHNEQALINSPTPKSFFRYLF